MKIIFLGRKPYSIKALNHLIDQNCEILGIVSESKPGEQFTSSHLQKVAINKNIKVYTESEIYDFIENENSLKNSLDLVISYLYPNKIKKQLINAPSIGCINFHPAPLPELRGLGGYNIAIYENMKQYGVSAHFVDETFDTGDIIKIKRFDINPEEETAFSLEQKSQLIMFELFKEVIQMAIKDKKLPRQKQGEGRYVNKKEYLSLSKINLSDSPEQINRKIRAFWYPPYPGASISINGIEYTLVNDNILKEVADLYHK